MPNSGASGMTQAFMIDLCPKSRSWNFVVVFEVYSDCLCGMP